MVDFMHDEKYFNFEIISANTIKIKFVNYLFVMFYMSDVGR